MGGEALAVDEEEFCLKLHPTIAEIAQLQPKHKKLWVSGEVANAICLMLMVMVMVMLMMLVM